MVHGIVGIVDVYIHKSSCWCCELLISGTLERCENCLEDVPALLVEFSRPKLMEKATIFNACNLPHGTSPPIGFPVLVMLFCGPIFKGGGRVIYGELMSSVKRLSEFKI